MTGRGWAGLIAAAALTAGTVAASPGEDLAAKPPAPYDLTCWQAGQPVLRETGIAGLPRDGLAGIVFPKTDGSSAILLDYGSLQALCLLRQPGG